MLTGSFASIRPLNDLVGVSWISRIGTRTSLWMLPAANTRLLLGNVSLLCGSRESFVAIISVSSVVRRPETVAAIDPPGGVRRRKKVSATLVAPFASITWSRFYGSSALPRKTLSLRPAAAGPVGSPMDERKIGPTTRQVKQWCSSTVFVGEPAGKFKAQRFARKQIAPGGGN